VVELRAGSLAPLAKTRCFGMTPTENETQTNPLPSDNVPVPHVSALGVAWIL
jgi:hypothetical protein